MTNIKFFGTIFFIITILLIFECRKQPFRPSYLNMRGIELFDDTVYYQWIGDTIKIYHWDRQSKDPTHLLIIK